MANDEAPKYKCGPEFNEMLARQQEGLERCSCLDWETNPAAVAATVCETQPACPRIVRPTCRKGYEARCTERGGPRGVTRPTCCTKMTCVPVPLNSTPRR